MKNVIEGSSTLLAVVFSLANINLVITTIILLLTAAYWVVKLKKAISSKDGFN